MSMSFTIYVHMKKLGKQKGTALQPHPFVLDEKPKTLRQLLIGLTKIGVRQYNERKDKGQILEYLTREEIQEQAVRGKISFGLQDGAKAVEKQAIENTLQCFEDGIYRLFVGEEELTKLSQMIPWTENRIVTFVKLTMLSG